MDRDREPRTITTKDLPHRVVILGGGVRIVKKKASAEIQGEFL